MGLKSWNDARFPHRNHADPGLLGLDDRPADRPILHLHHADGCAMITASPKVLIVEGRFYTDIADAMMAGVSTVLDNVGAAYERVTVPGALEIPAAIAFAHEAAKNGRSLPGYDGFVALGCVIRGETSHYDYVCGESARGLQDLAVREKLAIANGILTCENREQAWARAAVEQKNKGGAVARACLDMIALRRHFGL